LKVKRGVHKLFLSIRERETTDKSSCGGVARTAKNWGNVNRKRTFQNPGRLGKGEAGRSERLSGGQTCLSRGLGGGSADGGICFKSSAEKIQLNRTKGGCGRIAKDRSKRLKGGGCLTFELIDIQGKGGCEKGEFKRESFQVSSGMGS